MRPAIDTTGHMNPEFHSAIFETNPRIAAAMGIGLRGRHHPGLGPEMGIDLGIEPQSDLIAVSAGVPVPLDLGLLALPIPEIGDIAAQARDLEAAMKEKPIFPCLEGLPVMCPRSRFSSWRKLTGMLPHLPSTQSLTLLTHSLETSCFMWRTLFAIGACG